MKQILLVGKTNEDGQQLASFLSQYFGVQTFDSDLTTAGGMISAMKPDLLMISVDGLLLAPMMTLTELRNANPDTPTVTFGKVDDFVRFEKLYVGDPIENVNLPLNEESAFYIVCTKLKVSQKKVKEAAKGKKKVLVIDDDATTLRSTKSMLENQYAVSLANSGPKGLEMIEKDRPDLIILDYDMPGMNGREVLQKIRENKELDTLPVLFVTGVTDKSNITSLISLHPAGYLLKPVSMDVLTGEIEKNIKK